MEKEIKQKLTSGIRTDLLSRCSTKQHYEAISDYLDEDIKEIVDTVESVIKKASEGENGAVKKLKEVYIEIQAEIQEMQGGAENEECTSDGEWLDRIIDLLRILVDGEKEKWLVTMELRAGEYYQPFKKIFEVKEAKELKGKVHEYLVTYYDDGHEIIDGIYYFNGGEVACKYVSAQRIDCYEQLINSLK